MFRFSTHPAYITVTQGVQDAIHYLTETWQKWLPVAAAIAVCDFAIYAVIGGASNSPYFYTDPYTNQLTLEPDAGNRLFGVIALFGLTMIVTVVSSWVYNAVAISGLRNRPITIAWLVERGIMTIAASILIGLVVVVAVIGLAIVTVIIPPIGILLILGAIPIAIYFEIRLIFVTLAIFDGFGPIDGIKEAWRLSDGSAMRLFGWGLMAVLLLFVVGLIGGLVAIPFTFAAQPVGQAITGGLGAVGSCFTVFMMAVLYESERARKNPAAYGLNPPPNPYAPGPYPAGPNPYAAGPNPYAPSPQAPYPPNPYAAYPAAPPAPAPYPYGQPQYPAAPPAPVWQGTPPPLQAWPAAPQPAPQGWTPGQQPNLPYQGAAPGYPGSQPPQWGAPSAPPAWPQTPSAPPAWGAGSTLAPAAAPAPDQPAPAPDQPAPDQPTATPQPEPGPTDPPAAG